MSNLRRAPVSKWLEEFLTENGFTVALMSAEDKHGIKTLGWQGEAQKPGSVFEPYGIIIPSNVSKPPTTALQVNASDWDLPYMLTIFGVDVQQVEDIADDIRQLSGPFHRNDRPTLVMNGHEWGISRITNTGIGGVGWNNQVSPAMYSQTDSYEVTLSRSI